MCSAGYNENNVCIKEECQKYFYVDEKDERHCLEECTKEHPYLLEKQCLTATECTAEDDYYIDATGQRCIFKTEC